MLQEIHDRSSGIEERLEYLQNAWCAAAKLQTDKSNVKFTTVYEKY